MWFVQKSGISMILVPMYVVCSFSVEPSFRTLFSDSLKRHCSTSKCGLCLILPLCDPQSEALHLSSLLGSLALLLPQAFPPLISFLLLSQDMKHFFPNSSAPSSSSPPACPLSPLRTTLDWHPTHQPAFQGSIPVFSSGHQKSGKSQPFQGLSLYQTLNASRVLIGLTS